MNEQEIINFRNLVKEFSLEQLEKERADIQNAISKMILDSDLMIKAAIIENLIKDKQNG
jgi:hypothetical protein